VDSIPQIGRNQCEKLAKNHLFSRFSPFVGLTFSLVFSHLRRRHHLRPPCKIFPEISGTLPASLHLRPSIVALPFAILKPATQPFACKNSTCKWHFLSKFSGLDLFLAQPKMFGPDPTWPKKIQKTSKGDFKIFLTFSHAFLPILLNNRFYFYTIRYKSYIKIPGFLWNISKKSKRFQNF
jgi:hypothetical protein